MTRKLSSSESPRLLVVAGVSAAAQSPYRAQEPAPQAPSKGVTAIQHAAGTTNTCSSSSGGEDRQTSAMWSVFQSAMGKLADRADSVAVNVSDPAEKPMVAKFGVDRSPLPLVLAIAPNGAITKGFPQVRREPVSQAFVSRVPQSA